MGLLILLFFTSKLIVLFCFNQADLKFIWSIIFINLISFVMTTKLYKHASLEDIRLYLSRNEYPSPSLSTLVSRGEKSNFRRSAKKYELIENQMFVRKSGKKTCKEIYCHSL